MTIKILDSWLRDFLKTKARPGEIAEKLSLTSISIEKIEKYGSDYLYEIEVTTNRPDLFSVIGIAREAAAILPQFGIEAEFIPLKTSKPEISKKESPIIIRSDAKIVNRVLAVLMEVKIGNSSLEVKERLEGSGIRSLNNIIDVTNYVMRIVGHPTHVFDYDRLNSKELIIKEAQKGRKIVTLDDKIHTLNGGEIIAENEKGEIVDLLGVMGTKNSVVSENTKRILYFIDNNDPIHIRNASMALGIRTEAATLNEKGVDPELAEEALYYGIELFENFAEGKIISDIIDIYPNKPIQKTIEVRLNKINKVMGIEINLKKSLKALETLGFKPVLGKTLIKVNVPSFRLNDIAIEEDIIEEIARIYGYHNLPSILPSEKEQDVSYPYVNDFFWEKRTKEALKYWGFTETYTYSFVSEQMYEGPVENAVEIANPLTEDFVYMRNSIIPSLLKVVSENKAEETIKIFEIANVYLKRVNDLPEEILTLAGVVKKENISFFEIKGTIERVFEDLGIKNLFFKKSKKGGLGASVYIDKEYIGEIEVLDTDIVDFELNFEIILKHASAVKEFKPFAKYPPITEDLAFITPQDVSTQDLISEIKKQNEKITDVFLMDSYADSRTFHITYQDPEKNLTNKDTSVIREKIINSLKEKFGAQIKG